MSSRDAVRVGISGAAGRMGRRLVALTLEDPILELAAAIESSQHPELGQDAAALAGKPSTNVTLSDQIPENVGVIIDFSVPEGAEHITRRCIDRKIPLVMATTGLTEAQNELIRQLAESVPVVQAPSMSTAVNLMMKLTMLAARSLAAAGIDADAEIIERHHRFKEDAPSGTALRFGEIIAQEMNLTQHQHGREGRPGVRPRDEIAYHAVRTGDNPGEHTMILGMLGETIELTVRASSRDCYASGALTAAKFVVRQPPGLYDMFDVLQLDSLV